jgi:hypothetical protein
MGELALRYPAQSLVVSTGAYQDAASSDRFIPQTVDRVGIRATRLRTINGLALWTARAARLERRHHFGFAWCGELKPAGYPAWWLAKRYRVPYGVVVHGTELLLLDHKIRASRFKRWTAGGLVAGATVLAANSSWTAAVARRLYDLLGRADLAARVQVVASSGSLVAPEGADARPLRSRGPAPAPVGAPRGWRGRLPAAGPRLTGRSRSGGPRGGAGPARPGDYGQMYPLPLGFLKQPTDSGSSCFGSHSTTFGNCTQKAMVIRKTT